MSLRRNRELGLKERAARLFDELFFAGLVELGGLSGAPLSSMEESNKPRLVHCTTHFCART